VRAEEGQVKYLQAVGVNLRGARREPAGSEIRPCLSDLWWKPLIFQPDHVEDMVTEVVFVWTNARLSTNKVVIVFDVLNVASRSSYY
jgi:hypothetical protein